MSDILRQLAGLSLGKGLSLRPQARNPDAMPQIDPSQIQVSAEDFYPPAQYAPLTDLPESAAMQYMANPYVDDTIFAPESPGGWEFAGGATMPKTPRRSATVSMTNPNANGFPRR